MTVDSGYFGLELIRKLHKGFALGSVAWSERRSQVIEREVDIVEGVSNLVSDGCGKSAHNCAFFCLMQLRLQLACATELSSHLVE
jgi:hypothetical protein